MPEHYKITGRIASKKNSKQIITVKGRPMLIPSSAYKTWHKSALYELRPQVSGEPINKCSEIKILIKRKDKRKFDIDNSTSSILDTLVDAKILEDDNWSVVPKLTVEYMRAEEDCAEITIE